MLARTGWYNHHAMGTVTTMTTLRGLFLHNDWARDRLLAAARSLAGDKIDEPMEMGPGDYINIPAHKRHRVEWTTEDEPTVWLVVFYGSE